MGPAFAKRCKLKYSYTTVANTILSSDERSGGRVEMPGREVSECVFVNKRATEVEWDLASSKVRGQVRNGLVKLSTGIRCWLLSAITDWTVPED